MIIIHQCYCSYAVHYQLLTLINMIQQNISSVWHTQFGISKLNWVKPNVTIYQPVARPGSHVKTWGYVIRQTLTVFVQYTCWTLRKWCNGQLWTESAHVLTVIGKFEARNVVNLIAEQPPLRAYFLQDVTHDCECLRCSYRFTSGGLSKQHSHTRMQKIFQECLATDLV